MEKENFLKELTLEMENWEKEELLKKQDIENIKSYYKNKGLIDGTKSNMFITYISIIGAILVGVGFILYFSANWDNISNLIKVVIIISAVLISYFAGFYLVYIKKNYIKTGYAMILLGSIFYGSAIFLLGQIYNMGGTFYQAMLIWLIGVFPLVYITNLRPLLILCFLLFYGFLFGYIEDFYKSVDAFDIFITISSISLLFISMSSYHKNNLLKLGEVYSLVGFLGLYFIFFFFSFKDFWNIYDFNENFPVLIIWLILVFSLILNLYSKFRDKDFELKLNIGEISFFLATLFLSFIYFEPNIIKNDTFYIIPLFINIFYFFMIINLFYLGEKKNNSGYINMATFFLIIFILAKYFDLFYDMMSGSLFFIGFGVLLLLSSYFLEKRRKKIVSGLK